MLIISYYLVGAAALLLIRHPEVAMLVALPLLYFCGDNPIMFWPGIMGVATAYQAIRSLKRRAWPARHFALLLAAPTLVMEVWGAHAADAGIPLYTYGLLVLLVSPLCLSWEMLYRYAPYVAGSTLLCTAVVHDSPAMQLNVLVAQALFTTLVTFFLGETNKRKEDED